MKKYLPYLTLLICSTLFSLAAWAADAPPAFVPSVLGVISAVKTGALAGILLAIGQLLKSDLVVGLLGQINTKVIPWVTTVTGVLISVATSLAQGQPWYIGLAEGIIASLASNGIFDHFKVAQSS